MKKNVITNKYSILALTLTMINIFAIFNVNAINEIIILLSAAIFVMDMLFIPMLIILTIIHLANLWDRKQSPKK
ncbi:hypothetical protein ACLEEK_04355 [Lonsdalea quercina]|uniref:hypothetical protein n=1 Tax=Lonsdalea quercina TaxID=71657 RepID=UPI00397660E9